MLEVSFFELVVIFGVALIVLGPTRLPGLVRQIGRWVGKARSMARQFREQLESEVNIEELNRMTEKRAKEARASTPPPEPGISGEPAPGSKQGAAPADDTDLTTSGYPYGAPEKPANPPSASDDTFSHAHADGAAPATEPEPSTADPQPSPAGESAGRTERST